MRGGGLSLNYNHLVQAAIYRNISPELARFLHDRGFLYGKRAFKLFTFSRLLGPYRVKGGRIFFDGEVSLYVSSCVERFIKEIANSMVKRGGLFLGDSEWEVIGLEFPRRPEISNEVKIRMLSPMTVYSTLSTPDLKKKTYYYSPYEKEFRKLIDSNAKKKHLISHNKDIKSSLTIRPLKVREVVLMYKDTVVKGWLGFFTLKGPKTLIETVYDVGLGSKNPQGFGMFEVLKK